MATTEFKVFHGVGAVIVQVTSHTKFSVLARVNQAAVDFSTTDRLFEVDLEATPGTVGLKNWSEVKFDDRGVDHHGKELAPQLDVVTLPRGITTLGSGGVGDLTSGRFIGGVYVEHGLYNTLYESAISLPGSLWPQCAGLTLAEVTSIAYSRNGDNGARAKKRYHGFHGRLLARGTSADHGPMIKVAIHHTLLDEWVGPWWFELDDASQCDRDPPLAALGRGQSLTADSTKIDSEGALFVALPYAASTMLSLNTPKLPISQGG